MGLRAISSAGIGKSSCFPAMNDAISARASVLSERPYEPLSLSITEAAMPPSHQVEPSVAFHCQFHAAFVADCVAE